MAQATDRKIWKHAADNKLCIVSKDEDFVLMHAADPTGPSVVWIRIGNTIRRLLLPRLATAWPAVVGRLEQGDTVVEVR